LLCSVIFIFTLYFIFHFSDDDIIFYQKYLNRHSRYLKSANLKSFTNCQDREKVQKDIWFSGESFRPHLRITSDNSKLKLMQEKSSAILVEELNNIECWMQDKIDMSSKMQHIRHFTAKEGIYNFISHNFRAKEINLDFFTFPGITLPNNFSPHQSYLNGTSDDLTFSFRNRIPFILASKLFFEITLDQEL